MLKYSIGGKEIWQDQKHMGVEGFFKLEKKSNWKEGEDKLGAISQRGGA